MYPGLGTYMPMDLQELVMIFQLCYKYFLVCCKVFIFIIITCLLSILHNNCIYFTLVPYNINHSCFVQEKLGKVPRTRVHKMEFCILSNTRNPYAYLKLVSTSKAALSTHACCKCKFNINQPKSTYLHTHYTVLKLQYHPASFACLLYCGFDRKSL